MVLYKLATKEKVLFQRIFESLHQPGYLVLVYVSKEGCLPCLNSASVSYMCQRFWFFRTVCFNVSSLSKRELVGSRYRKWTLLTHYLIFRENPVSFVF